MHTKTKWYCDICGSEFSTQAEAEECEAAHVKDEQTWTNKGIAIFFNLKPFYCIDCEKDVMGVCEDCGDRLDIQGTYNIEPVFNTMERYPRQLTVKMADNKLLTYNLDYTTL